VLAASFALSASTWTALGELAGFHAEASVVLPYIGRPRLAWLVPVAYDGYVCVALMTWMAPVPVAIASFARRNTYVAAGLGVVVQSAYHAYLTFASTALIALAALAAFVGAIPVGVSAVAIHMRALVAREGRELAPAAPRLASWVASVRGTLAAPLVAPVEALEASPRPALGLIAPEPSTAAQGGAPGGARGNDELAPRRAQRAEGAEAMAEALHKAWGSEPPTRTREAAKALLRVGSNKADAALRLYKDRYLGSETERVTQ
jgi:hypothetical protein